MDRLIYTALSGMQSSMNQQRVLASNLANANTTGFRAEIADQRPVTIDGETLEARAFQHMLVRSADLAQGPVTQTGRNLDIALTTGDALIAVQPREGGEAYTRRGDLTLNATGLLVNGEGYPVVGDSGPIAVPPGGEISISEDGTVSVANAATPEAPPTPVGRIKLAAWSGSAIAKGLDGLFRVEGGGTLPADLEVRVNSGALEQSNVKTTEILVEMIDEQRLFAMRTQLIRTASELDESGSRLLRLG